MVILSETPAPKKLTKTQKRRLKEKKRKKVKAAKEKEAKAAKVKESKVKKVKVTAGGDLEQMTKVADALVLWCRLLGMKLTKPCAWQVKQAWADQSDKACSLQREVPLERRGVSNEEAKVRIAMSPGLSEVCAS